MSLRKKTKEGNDPGFTLLEVLISLAILALVVTMVYASFDTSIKIIDRVDGEADLYREARFVLSRMSEELSMAYRPKGNPVDGTYFLGLDEAMEGRSRDSIRFTSLSHNRYIAGQASSDLNNLEYTLEEGPEPAKGWTLLRSEKPNPYSLSDKGGDQFVIAERIESFNLRFYDGKTWVDSWNSEEQRGLPRMVEIAVKFRQQGGNPIAFQTRIRIPLAE